MKVRLLVLLFIAVAFCLSATAQLQPTLEKGFQAGKAYSFSDIDSVNLFNGNLNVSIPMGATFNAGGDLRYGFNLNYSGNNWSYYYRHAWVVIKDEGLPTVMSGYEDQNWSEPFKRSNAGIGWLFTLGRIYNPDGDVAMDSDQWDPAMDPSRLVYQAPDGSEHELLGALHSNVNASETTTPRYSRDGSYIRYSRLTTAGTLSGHKLEFADGTIREFGTDGSIREIRDRHGNAITIQYGDETTLLGASTPDSVLCGSTYNIWKISDQYGRAHYAYFLRRTQSPTKLEPYKERLCQMDVLSFEGTRAIYKFEYANRWLSRQGVKTTEPADPTVISNRVTAPLLKRVLLPDGTAYEAVYDIGKTTTTGLTSSGTTDPTELSYIATGANPGSFTGHLVQLKVPTGGTYVWNYKTYSFPPSRYEDKPGVEPGSEFPEERTYRDTSAGVFSRQKVSPGQSTGPMWKYESSVLAHSGSGKQVAAVTTVTAPAPDETKTQSYFSACHDCPEGYAAAEFGLPFSRRPEASGTAHGVNPRDGKYISTRVVAADGTVLRTTYVTYEYEVGGTTVPSNFNARPNSTLTVTDDGKTTTETYSDFDGYGHYRKREASASDGAIVRTTTTNYNPSSGTYPASFTLMPETQNWLIETYDSVEVKDRNVVTNVETAQKTQYCFDAATGFLQWRRSLRGSTPANSDLLAVFRDANTANAEIDGSVSQEEYYGGDVSPIPATFDGTCTLTGLTGPTYRLLHTYSYGGRKTTQYDGLLFKSLDVDVDASGAVKTSRDSAGVSTAYKYDILGRVKGIQPAGRAWTEIEYTAASGTTGPSAVARVCPKGVATCSSTALAESRYYYDSFGRLTQERQRVASSPDPEEWAVTWTTYDNSDRKKTVSVVASATSGAQSLMPAGTKFTEWSYDSLGRTLSVTQPDGYATSYTYSGSRQVSRYSNIATGTTGSQVGTQENYDFLGRLTTVIEDIGAGQANLTTFYKYDTGDRLIDVDGPGPNAPARTFTYDGAGLLTSETHPESGTATYKYDSRGHVVEKRAADCRYDLNYTLDAGERIRKVEGRAGSVVLEDWCTVNTWRLLKEFIYDADASSSNKSMGKTRQAIRHNPTGPVIVTEVFTYGDEAGRVTKKETNVVQGSGSPVQIFEQKFRYDDLDQIVSSIYPVCMVAPGCGQPTYDGMQIDYRDGRPKAATTGYYAAMLDDLTPADPLATFEQHANGLRTETAHANGVTDAVTVDSSGMARPRQITYSGFSQTCVAPTVSAPASTTVTYGATTTLTAFPAGSGPFSYQWHSSASTQPDQVIPGATSQSYITPSVTQKQEYWVTVTSSCGTASTSQTRTVVTPVTQPPTALTAMWGGGATVSLSWTAPQGAQSYSVERRTNGAAFAEVGTTTATSYTDASCASGATCVYRVRAFASDAASSPSSPDLATLIAFTTITPLVTIVDDAHFNEILTALNAVRAAAGATALSWADILPAGVASPAADVLMNPAHVTALRTRMDEALQLHVIPVTAYEDTSPTLIRVRHLEQLRERTQ